MNFEKECIQYVIDCFEEAKRQAIEAITTKKVNAMSFEVVFEADECAQIRANISENYI